MDYPNDKNIERVWAYLDGELNGKAKQDFEQELKENLALAQSLEAEMGLHQSLYNLELEKAPESIADAVMKQIAPQVLTTKPTSFGILKYFGLGFILLNIGLLVIAIGDIQSGIAVGNSLQQYTVITKQITKVTSLLSSVEWSTSYKFVLGAALLMMMYFVDQILYMKRHRKAKV